MHDARIRRSHYCTITEHRLSAYVNHSLNYVGNDEENVQLQQMLSHSRPRVTQKLKKIVRKNEQCNLDRFGPFVNLSSPDLGIESVGDA